MLNTELDPELMESIKRAAKIGACADLLAEIAFENDLSPQTCSAMIIALADKKLAELKANK